MQRGLAVLLAMAMTVPVHADPPAFVETTLPGPEGRDHSRPAWPIRARLA